MAVTWKFANLEQMASFMKKNAAELSERSERVPEKREAAGLKREAFGWRQAAMIVENSVIEAEATL